MRAGLDKKDTRGRIVAPRVPKVPKNPILINGEKLTAKQALEKYPQLREFLQSKRKISEKSLQAKYRTWMRKGKIPDEVIDPEPEIVPRGRLLGNNVLGQYTIHSRVSTSPRDFLDRTENVVITFLKNICKTRCNSHSFALWLDLTPRRARLPQRNKRISIL